MEEQKDYLEDSGHVHDSLLYGDDAGTSLEAYYDMIYNMETDIHGKLPEESQSLIDEIDEIIKTIEKPLREKVIRLYFLLSGGDNSLEE